VGPGHRQPGYLRIHGSLRRRIAAGPRPCGSRHPPSATSPRRPRRQI